MAHTRKKLLAAASGFAVVQLVAPATAADLPSRKAAPVEYVRVCSEHGAGFFYIPGSETCMRVGGRIRAEYRYEEPFTRNANTIRSRARGYFTLDSRTSTDYGTLRATTRVYMTRDTGRGAGAFNLANVTNGAATTTTDVALDYAYIQFAGLTAGRLQYSFFDFSPLGDYGILDVNYVGRGAYNQSINALAYTASLGNGFTATLAMEDSTERVVGISSYTPYTPGFGGFAVAAQAWGGASLPDIVGRLEWMQPWGAVVLAGAIHQNRLSASYAAPTNGLTNTTGVIIDTKYGYAVNAGLKLNLPMIAPGDALEMSAVWAYGASSYTGWTQAGTAGSQTVAYRDALLVPGAAEMSLSRSYSLSAALQHYWTPTLRSAFFGAYGGLNQQGDWFDVRAFTAGANLFWAPVKGFEIGGEVYWSTLIGTPVSAYPYVASNNAFFRGDTSADNWGTRIRFQRDF